MEKVVSNRFLIVAGLLSFIASVLHLTVIIGGPDWYRFFGAGEEMAVLAEQGSLIPVVITLFVAVVLAVWGLYAFSGAGIIRRLPFLWFCLVVITGVYLLRGVGGIGVLYFSGSNSAQSTEAEFMLWSSIICAAYGVIHLIGLIKGWAFIRQR